MSLLSPKKNFEQIKELKITQTNDMILSETVKSNRRQKSFFNKATGKTEKIQIKFPSKTVLNIYPMTNGYEKRVLFNSGKRPFKVVTLFKNGLPIYSITHCGSNKTKERFFDEVGLPQQTISSYRDGSAIYHDHKMDRVVFDCITHFDYRKGFNPDFPEKTTREPDPFIEKLVEKLLRNRVKE